MVGVLRGLDVYLLVLATHNDLISWVFLYYSWLMICTKRPIDLVRVNDKRPSSKLLHRTMATNSDSADHPAEFRDSNSTSLDLFVVVQSCADTR